MAEEVLPDAGSAMEDDVGFFGATTAGNSKKGAEGAAAATATAAAASATKGIHLQKLMKQGPSVVASKLRAKTLKKFNSVGAMQTKSMDAAQHALEVAEKELGDSFDSDLTLMIVKKRLELVEAMSTSLDVRNGTMHFDEAHMEDINKKIRSLVSEDLYLSDAGMHPDSLMTHGQLVWVRLRQSMMLASAEAVVSLFEKHEDAMSASLTCAQSLRLDLIVRMRQ